jgi:Leucine-rich repeat (LRR) protein
MDTIIATVSTITAPIDTIDLSGNLLTKVPTNLAQQFVNVTTLSLASNGITSIGSGELSLKATVVSLDVSNNSISTIASGALPGDDLYNLISVLYDFKLILKFDFY